MPAAQLVTSGVEGLLNGLLSLDPDIQKKMQPLQGKRLSISLLEMPWSLLLSFSDRIDVISYSEEPLENDCAITLNIFTLGELRDSSQVTRLIQEQRLVLEGDIHVAQHFSELVKTLNIDWEEHLSKFVGDAAAHKSMYFAKQAGNHLKQTLAQFANILAEGAIEEKQLVAPKVAVDKYIEDVNSLRSRSANLEARIQKLESSGKQ